MHPLHLVFAVALLWPLVPSAAAGPADADAAYAAARRDQGYTGESMDLPRALVHLRRAAGLGPLQAQVDLAFAHLNGQALAPKDLAESFRWFSAAARGGSAAAQCMLGDFYQQGAGGAPQDDAEAVHWYRLSAERDDRCAARSQHALFLAYESGRGVPRDLGVAIQWLQRAAENGNPVAQAALGRAYRTGHGVEPDAELARRWLRLSREGVSPHEDHEHETRSFAGPRLLEKLAPLAR